MLHRAVKLVVANREKLVSLVLLPAFFLGSLPQTACICADGHREASCPMLRQQQAESARSCCQKSASAPKSCCKNGSSKTNQLPSKCQVAAQGRSCCHPVIEAPAAAAAAKRSEVDNQPLQLTVSASASSFVVAAELWPTTIPTIDSTPPPRDVVIELSRLTI